jgi:hypothetical protein
MKKSILFLVIAAVLTGCGGGFSAKRLPESEVFGNIPSIVYEKMQQDSVIQTNGLAEMESVKEDDKKAEKIFDKYQKRYEEAKAKFEAAIEKEIAALNGKAIPFSQGESLGYEVTDVKIYEVSPDGEVQIGFRVKITDASKLKLSFPWADLNGNFPCPVQLLNKSGEVMVDKSYQCIYFLKNVKKDGELRTITNASEMKNGYDFYQVASFKINKDNAETYADAAKVHFPQHN